MSHCCSSGRCAALPNDLDECLRRRVALEDLPMRRIVAHRQTSCSCAASCCPCCCSTPSCDSDALPAALDEQIHLLYDILCAVNSLTAARLAGNGCKG